MAKGKEKEKMSTITVVPSPGIEKSLIRKTVMTADLDDVLIGREFSFTPISTPEEASARIGGDPDKFLKVLNAGLRTLERESAGEAKDGWFIFGEDGKLSDKVASGESAGDPQAINALINNFAKVSTPNWADLKAPQKNDVRDRVRGILKSNPAMLEMLKASAAAPTAE